MGADSEAEPGGGLGEAHGARAERQSRREPRALVETSDLDPQTTHKNGFDPQNYGVISHF